MNIKDLYSKYTGIAEMDKDELLEEREACIDDIETCNSGVIFLPQTSLDFRIKEAKEKIKLIDYRLEKIKEDE